MFRYIWKTEWWPAGLSAWAFALRLARLNHLSTADAAQLLLRDSKSGGTSFVIDAYSQSHLDLLRIGSELGKSECRVKDAFPVDFSATQSIREVSPHLRYCRECLEEGAHFSWQQLRWLKSCPLHGQELQDKCQCGRRVRYRMTMHSLKTGSFCTCGVLAPRLRSSVDCRSHDRLTEFVEELSKLRSILGNGFAFVRLDRSPPSRAERSKALSLVHTLLADEWRESDRSETATLPIPTRCITVRGVVDLAELVAKAHRVLSLDRLNWHDARIVRYVADEILQTWTHNAIVDLAQNQAIAFGNVEMNNTRELTALAGLVLVRKTFKLLEDGKLPKFDNRQSILAQAARFHGFPLCLARFPSADPAIQHAAIEMVSIEEKVPTAFDGWQNDFRQFLVTEFYAPDNKETGMREESVVC